MLLEIEVIRQFKKEYNIDIIPFDGKVYGYFATRKMVGLGGAYFDKYGHHWVELLSDEDNVKEVKKHLPNSRICKMYDAKLKHDVYKEVERVNSELLKTIECH
jgi:hypothetical protein